MADERHGTHYSQLLFEKGFDNVYLLSGGIEKFFENHRELVEGTHLPEPPKPKVTKRASQTGKSSLTSTKSSFKTTASKK